MSLRIVILRKCDFSFEGIFRNLGPDLHFLNDLILLELYIPHHLLEILLPLMGYIMLELIDILMSEDIDGILILEYPKKTVFFIGITI